MMNLALVHAYVIIANAGEGDNPPPGGIARLCFTIFAAYSSALESLQAAAPTGFVSKRATVSLFAPLATNDSAPKDSAQNRCTKRMINKRVQTFADRFKRSPVAQDTLTINMAPIITRNTTSFPRFRLQMDSRIGDDSLESDWLGDGLALDEDSRELIRERQLKLSILTPKLSRRQAGV
jgi:hypothetical protein